MESLNLDTEEEKHVAMARSFEVQGGVQASEKKLLSDGTTTETDLRKKVTIVQPNKLESDIGQLLLKFEDDYYIGTGTIFRQLDGRVYVITCAHNLVHWYPGGNYLLKACGGYFFPGRTNDRIPCRYNIVTV